MAKKIKLIKQETVKEPLTKEELIKYQPEDQAAKLQEIMGFDLSTAYKVGLELNSDNPAVVAKQTTPETKGANVDALPKTKQ